METFSISLPKQRWKMAMLKHLQKQLGRLIQDDDGPTAVEYAVMLSLIIGVCLASVQSLSNATRASFDESAQSISSSMSP
jgi:pilus assembly protein Flp/PilA